MQQGGKPLPKFCSMIPQQARFSDQLVCLSMFLALVWKVDDPELGRGRLCSTGRRENLLHNHLHSTMPQVAGRPGVTGLNQGSKALHFLAASGITGYSEQDYLSRHPSMYHRKNPKQQPPLMGVARGTAGNRSNRTKSENSALSWVQIAVRNFPIF